MGLLLLLGIFAVCVTIGVPVAFALAVAAIGTFAYEGLIIGTLVVQAKTDRS